MSSTHIAPVQGHLIDQQGAVQEHEVATASDKPKVDITNPLHPLHPSNGDLRIVPQGYEIPEGPSTPVMAHHDLRMLEVPDLE